MKRGFLTPIAVLLMLVAAAASAQTYPVKAVRILTSPPGGDLGLAKP